MEPKQTKSEKLLDILLEAGPAGILNSELAANPDVGWCFNAHLGILRKQGHIIEKCRVGSVGRVYRIVLVKAAPAAELRPIIALLMAAQEGVRG